LSTSKKPSTQCEGLSCCSSSKNDSRTPNTSTFSGAYFSPSTFTLKEGAQSFKQEIGVPQGASISPLLFNTYLDALLEETGLLSHKVLGYVDDLVFIAESEKKVCEIITKLERLSPDLNLNKQKCGIMVQ